jgi:hypothetical protein
MRNIGNSDEAVTHPQLAHLIADRHAKSACSNVRRLTMRMMMHRPDGVCLEVHAHHHEIGNMAEQLAAHTSAELVPLQIGRDREWFARGECCIRQSRDPR